MSLTLDQNKLPVVAGDFAGTLQLRGTEDSDDGIEYLTLIGSSDTNASDSNASSQGTISLSVVDLNGDGMLDVLTENHSSEFSWIKTKEARLPRPFKSILTLAIQTIPTAINLEATQVSMRILDFHECRS